MLRLGRQHGMSIAEMMLANERTQRDDAAIFDGMRRIVPALRRSRAVHAVVSMFRASLGDASMEV